MAALDSLGVPSPTKKSQRSFRVYRYDPESGAAPAMQEIQVELDGSERMLLDALMKLKAIDPSLSSPLVPRRRLRLRRDEHQRQERPRVPHQHEDAQGPIVLGRCPGCRSSAT
jgi:hypothetical protein